jgi:pre-mRNA-splicing factor CDC5/CEF1
MKYGKNQWARISSLLVRKTPKQCKARWYEWLDPGIRKTEWSKEEEERLLHLAKIMPTQWRTIAPLVGRTPAQCLEHYEKLLDAAQNVDEEVMAANDPRRLRPGEIDHEPETKPARPDPIDMDEDEKEMLSEARARLANTQGKKAKRRAREKQLEEARRMATIQKRREMRAAGIFVRSTYMRKGEMNYNLETPFMRPIPSGYFDTTEEKAKQLDPEFKKITNLQKAVHGEYRDDVEAEKRKRDTEKNKARKAKGEPLNLEKMIKENEEEQIAKRTKMMLPAPQVSDRELDQIVKLGLQGENVRSFVDDEATPARTLLTDYQSVMTSAPLRTPRAPEVTDRVKVEAQKLLALKNLDTPLRGGQNVDVEGLEFDSLKPKSSTVQTPNPLLAQLTPRAVGSTPIGATPYTPQVNATPYRDTLNINETQIELQAVKQKLRDGFMNLPRPLNDFEVVLPEEEGGEEQREDIVEDQADIEEEEAKQTQKREEERKKLQTEAVSRGLPRPMHFNSQILDDALMINAHSNKYLDKADELIRKEMLRLMQNDALEHPVNNQRPTGVQGAVVDEEFTGEELEAAKKLISQNYDKGDTQIFEKVYNKCKEEFVFVPSAKRYVEKSSVTKGEIIESLSNEYHVLLEQLKQEAEEASKLEKKLSVVLGGHTSRNNTLKKKMNKMIEEIGGVEIDVACYTNLKRMEAVYMENRLAEYERLLDGIIQSESKLQREYTEYFSEYQQQQAQ